MLYPKMFLLIGAIAIIPLTAKGQTDEFHLEENYKIEANGTVLLKSNDAEVSIVGSDRRDVHVNIDYVLDVDGLNFGDIEEFDVEVRQENGNFYIEEQPREMDNIVIGSWDENYTIQIEVPAGVSLKLRGDDDNYTVKNIGGQIRVDAEDGEVNLLNCSGSYFAVRLDDGNLNMDAGKGVLKLQIEDGNAEITNGRFNSVRFQADDGDLSLHNRASTDGKYRFDFEDGTVELYLTDENANKMTFNTDDGDIAIHTALNSNGNYQIDMADGNLEFYATSGGGVFYIRHDDADISSDEAYQILENDEGRSKYRLGNGGAEIRIDADDADIELRAN